MEHSAGLVVDHGTVLRTFSNLKPAQRGEILYEVPDKTSQVVIDLSGITPALPPSSQNSLFGDDVYVSIHSAKTSSGAFGDYFFDFNPFVVDDTQIVIPHPEPGILRITLIGDTTNAGTISAAVMVTSSIDSLDSSTIRGDIRGGDNLFFPIEIPAGIHEARFQVRWDGEWGRYPTNDIERSINAAKASTSDNN